MQVVSFMDNRELEFIVCLFFFCKSFKPKQVLLLLLLLMMLFNLFRRPRRRRTRRKKDKRKQQQSSLSRFGENRKAISLFFGGVSLFSSEVRLTALLLAALITGCRLGGRLVVSPLISEHAGGRSSQGGAVRAQRGGGRDGE